MLYDCFTHHLPYEIQMLRSTYKELQRPALGDFRDSAFIETFCLHARNLIEFFAGKKNCHFDPNDFSDSWTIDERFLWDEYAKVCAQITHLQNSRTKLAKEKIGPSERKSMIDAIEDQLKKLQNQLKPEWKEEFSEGWLPKLTESANETIIVGGGPAQATNVTTSVSTGPITSRGGRATSNC